MTVMERCVVVGSVWRNGEGKGERVEGWKDGRVGKGGEEVEGSDSNRFILVILLL